MLGTEAAEPVYIIQGSNDPLIITFDSDVSELPKIVVSLWIAKPGISKKPLKIWKREDVTVDGAVVYCPLTERETAGLPDTSVKVLAKALNSTGRIKHWKEYVLDIMVREDKSIFLTEVGDSDA